MKDYIIFAAAGIALGLVHAAAWHGGKAFYHHTHPRYAAGTCS